jgi:hypothetical protein
MLRAKQSGHLQLGDVRDGLVQQGVVLHVLLQQPLRQVKSCVDLVATVGAEGADTMLELGLSRQRRLGDQPVGKRHSPAIFTLGA